MESRDRGLCFGVATIPSPRCGSPSASPAGSMPNSQVFCNCGHSWHSQPPVEAAQLLERLWATRT